MRRAPLYVTDLDGTLLLDDASLSDAGWEILAGLLRDGAPLTVASARSLISMRHVLRDLPLVLPVIEFNGAFLSDLATGEHLWIHDLPIDVAAALVETMDDFGTPPFLSTFDGEHDRLYAPPAINAGMQWYLDDRRGMGDPRLQQVDDVRIALGERTVCVTAIGEAERMGELARHLGAWGEAVDVSCWENSYSPGWHWISVHDRRATKDQAIDALIEHAGLGDVEVHAFGDQGNDLQLLRRADCGIAVANANEAVRAVADQVIGPNTQDSVPRWIRAHWRAHGSATTSHRDVDVDATGTRT